MCRGTCLAIFLLGQHVKDLLDVSVGEVFLDEDADKVDELWLGHPQVQHRSAGALNFVHGLENPLNKASVRIFILSF